MLRGGAGSQERPHPFSEHGGGGGLSKGFVSGCKKRLRQPASERASKSGFQAVVAAPLKTALSSRLKLRLSPRVMGARFRHTGLLPTRA